MDRRKFFTTASLASAALVYNSESNASENENTIKNSSNVYYFDNVETMRSANLSIGDFVITKGYYEVGDGGHSEYVIVEADELEDNGGSIISIAEQSLKAKLISSDSLNVKQFGAKGDGTNDTDAIKRAVSACTGELFFPRGEYGLDEQVQLTCSVRGESTDSVRIIWLKPDETTTIWMLLIMNQVDLSIKDLTIDGNAIGKGNHTTGGRTLHISYSARINVENVTATNSSNGAGFRLERSDDCRYLGCSSIGIRGVFGDGFYVESSSQTRYSNCYARDVERIGFVAEGSHDGIPSIGIYYENCIAKNSHNGSILRGETESNAGFWAENSLLGFYTNCYADDHTHYGFVCAPTMLADNFHSASFSYVNCTARRCLSNGFYFTGRNVKSNADYKNCNVFDSEVCYNIRNSGGGTAIYHACHGRSTGQNKNTSAIFAVDPQSDDLGALKCSITDCTGEWVSATGSDSNMNIGDITSIDSAHLGSIRKIIHVKNYRNYNAFVSFKNRYSPDARWLIEDCEKAFLYLVPVLGSNGKVTVKHTEVFGIVRANEVNLFDVKIANNRHLDCYDCRLKTDNLKMFESTFRHFVNQDVLEGPHLICDLNVDLSYDVTGSGSAIQLQYNQLLKSKALISGKLYNTNDHATESKSFIHAINSGTEVYAVGLVSDGNVKKTLKVGNALTTFNTGDTKIPMH